jgi:hypothetical protein
MVKYLKKCIVAIASIVVSLGVCVSPVMASSLSTNTRLTASTEKINNNDPYPKQSRVNALSDDGRITVFESAAPNIVPGDTNGVSDIFAYDRIAKKTERLSVGAGGVQANNASYNPTVSADGRYVAYATRATNITNQAKCTGTNCSLVVVLDRTTKQVTPASLNTLGLPLKVNLYSDEVPQPAVISADGNFVAFQSPSAINGDDTNGTNDILVRDLRAHVTRLASVDNTGHTTANGSWQCSISGDGRYVTFTTSGRLIPEDTNQAEDVYMHDMQQATTTLVSRAYTGEVAFGGSRHSYDAVISNNGRYVVFISEAEDIVLGDYNGRHDVFVRDLQTNKNQRISNAVFGGQPNGHAFAPSISSDGAYVVFDSPASNIVRGDGNGLDDVFLYYRGYGIARLITPYKQDSVYTGSASSPVISGNGKAISYSATTYNNTLYAYATNIYLNYNPAAQLPFYDNNDILDVFNAQK